MLRNNTTQTFDNKMNQSIGHTSYLKPQQEKFRNMYLEK